MRFPRSILVLGVVSGCSCARQLHGFIEDCCRLGDLRAEATLTCVRLLCFVSAHQNQALTSGFVRSPRDIGDQEKIIVWFLILKMQVISHSNVAFEWRNGGV